LVLVCCRLCCVRDEINISSYPKLHREWNTQGQLEVAVMQRYKVRPHVPVIEAVEITPDNIKQLRDTYHSRRYYPYANVKSGYYIYLDDKNWGTYGDYFVIIDGEKFIMSAYEFNTKFMPIGESE
jgi:hypothetical protein